MNKLLDALLVEARHWNVTCPSCGALMVPSGVPGTPSNWWDCINPFCLTGAQPE